MPYKVRKLPLKNSYRVYNAQTHKIHAYGTSKLKATRQMRLLQSLEGSGMRSNPDVDVFAYSSYPKLQRDLEMSYGSGTAPSAMRPTYPPEYMDREEEFTVEDLRAILQQPYAMEALNYMLSSESPAFHRIARKLQSQSPVRFLETELSIFDGIRETLYQDEYEPNNLSNWALYGTIDPQSVPAIPISNLDLVDNNDRRIIPTSSNFQEAEALFGLGDLSQELRNDVIMLARQMRGEDNELSRLLNVLISDDLLPLSEVNNMIRIINRQRNKNHSLIR